MTSPLDSNPKCLAAANLGLADTDQPLIVSGQCDVAGSQLVDTVVRKNGNIHIGGDLRATLTLEPGSFATIEGSIHGRVVNKGGKVTVKNNSLAGLAVSNGPSEQEVGAALYVNLSAIAENLRRLTSSTTAECAAVVKSDAYGCGADTVVAALAKCRCNTFFVKNLAEARQVRTVAQDVTIYVLDGFYPGSAKTFAEIGARPVIGSMVEIAEWDMFVKSTGWTGGFAVSIDTGNSRRGMPAKEASSLASRADSLGRGMSLIISSLDRPHDANNVSNLKKQMESIRDLRTLFRGIPFCIANSAGMFLGREYHFDMVRPGSALYGINPTPGRENPMRTVVELRARVRQLFDIARGEFVADVEGWSAARPSRIAVLSIGYLDGLPRVLNSSNSRLKAFVAGAPCPVVGAVSMDKIAVDVTDLSVRKNVRIGDVISLLGSENDSESAADPGQAAAKHVLSNLGLRFGRRYIID